MLDDFINSINPTPKSEETVDETLSSKKTQSLSLQKIKKNQQREKQNPRKLKPGPRVTNPKKTTSFSLEVAIVEALEQFVIENGITKSLVIKQALEKYLEEELKVRINWDKYRKKYN